MTPSEAPKALQASECSELLDPTRANCWISAQHQPGKFADAAVGQQDQNLKNTPLVPCSGKQEARTGSPSPQCLETLAGNGWSPHAKTTALQQRTTKQTKTMPDDKNLE
jgi:hypothetical protein